MLEELSPLAAAVVIPALWGLVAYRCWILPTLQRRDL